MGEGIGIRIFNIGKKNQEPQLPGNLSTNFLLCYYVQILCQLKYKQTVITLQDYQSV
jgi:hypothetical protein